MNLNSRFDLVDMVEVKDSDGGTRISNEECTVELTPTEQLILRHHDNYDLSEICVILREFYQMDDEQAREAVENFVEKLIDTNMICITENGKREVFDEKMLFVRNPSIELVVDDDETGILRDYNRGKMVYVNSTGVTIWNCLDEAKTIREIVEHLVSIYNASESRLSSDVSAFIYNLYEKGYLVLWDGEKSEKRG